MSKSSILFGYLAPLFSALVITGAIIVLIIFSYMDWRAANKEASFTEYFPGSLDHPNGAQNADAGKIGIAPAEISGMNLQGIRQ